MNEWSSRTELLLGAPALSRLAGAAVCVFGLGAVGGYVVEALARSGVGRLRLVDFDVIRESNMNRQILATRRTLGRPKAEAAAERVRDINPDARVEIRVEFAHAETLPGLLAGFSVPGGAPDLVVDAVDSVNPKTEIILAAAARGIPVFSSLGAATRLDAGAVRFGPLFAARGCPLGRVIRKRLRRRGLDEAAALFCVYSEEPRRRTAVRRPVEAEADGDYRRGRRRDELGSIATLTGLFGLRLAHEAIMRLIAEE